MALLSERARLRGPRSGLRWVLPAACGSALGEDVAQGTGSASSPHCPLAGAPVDAVNVEPSGPVTTLMGCTKNSVKMLKI